MRKYKSIVTKKTDPNYRVENTFTEKQDNDNGYNAMIKAFDKLNEECPGFNHEVVKVK